MINFIYWQQLDQQQRQAILQRPVTTNNPNLKQIAQSIIDRVKQGGDQAVIDLTRQYDQLTTNAFVLPVKPEEFLQARHVLSSESWPAVRLAIDRIRNYHRVQMPANVRLDTHDGVVCERQPRPIQRVGLYVPGGSTPLISTLMMLAIPAQLANCPLRVLCTPPQSDGKINPYLLAIAQECGIEHVYKVGGAQAIAAMAYGTETIPKVDKIYGPGNAWVMQAKLLIGQDSQAASIDMPAGPSELLVIADKVARPDYVAADLLSQAEHGPDSQVILISTSQLMTEQIQKLLYQQMIHLSRLNIIEQSLRHARFIIVDDIEQAIQISNQYAPEHLILQVANPEYYVPLIQCAGAVFLGAWAPETIGDYSSGSNHVLPTEGYARSYSGLSVTDFMTYINFQFVSAQGLQTIGPAAECLAAIEGLTAHLRAVRIRLQDLESKLE